MVALGVCLEWIEEITTCKGAIKHHFWSHTYIIHTLISSDQWCNLFNYGFVVM